MKPSAGINQHTSVVRNETCQITPSKGIDLKSWEFVTGIYVQCFWTVFLLLKTRFKCGDPPEASAKTVF